VIEKQKKEDALMDFLLKACDIGWNHNTSEYERKIHMQRRLKLYKWHCMIKTGKKLRKATTYIEKEWIKGHNDLDFKNAHKEPGYVGLWSFEAAALAKILDWTTAH